MRGAPLAERPAGVVLVAEGEQVERDERRRREIGEHVDPAGRRMDALLQRLEVQPVIGGDDDLTVDHATIRQLCGGRRDEFGEVAGHRPFVAAAAARHHHRRESRWTESRPTSARTEAPGGIAVTDLDSIGDTGGRTGSFIAPTPRR